VNEQNKETNDRFDELSVCVFEEMEELCGVVCVRDWTE